MAIWWGGGVKIIDIVANVRKGLVMQPIPV